MPKKFWFKNKTYGWGWTPASWEGWLVLGIQVLLITLLFVVCLTFFKAKFALVFFPGIIILMGIVLVICYKTGEKPEWRCGNKK